MATVSVGIAQKTVLPLTAVEVLRWDGELAGPVRFRFRAENGLVQFEVFLDDQLVQRVVPPPGTTYDCQEVLRCNRSIIIVAMVKQLAGTGDGIVWVDIDFPPNTVEHKRPSTAWERLSAYREEARASRSRGPSRT